MSRNVFLFSILLSAVFLYECGVTDPTNESKSNTDFEQGEASLSKGRILNLLQGKILSLTPIDHEISIETLYLTKTKERTKISGIKEIVLEIPYRKLQLRIFGNFDNIVMDQDISDNKHNIARLVSIAGTLFSKSLSNSEFIIYGANLSKSAEEADGTACAHQDPCAGPTINGYYLKDLSGCVYRPC